MKLGQFFASLPFALLLGIIISQSLGLEEPLKSIVYFCSGSAAFLIVNYFQKLLNRITPIGK